MDGVVEYRQHGMPALSFNAVQVRSDVCEYLEKNDKPAHITLEKMAYSRSRGIYMLFLHADRMLSMEEQERLKKRMLRQVPELRLFEVVIRQPAQELLEDAALLEKTIQAYIVSIEPSMIPFVRASQVRREENKLLISFARDMAIGFAERLGLAQRIEQFLSDTYGLQMHVKQIGADSDIQPEEEVAQEISMVFDSQMQPAPALAKREPKEQKTPKKRTSPPAATPAAEPPKRRNYGREALEGEPVKIIDLQPDETALICGEVISTEEKVTKDGKNTIFTMAVTDYTSTVRCRHFYKKAGEDFEAPAKKGDFIKTKGPYTYNSYTREYMLNFNQVTQVAKPPEKQDLAPEKRVELHLHTNMSAQDGMASAEEYIAQAAKWVHKAVAITDHGVVQAFPFAANAAKEEGIKVIFGVEAYMVDTPRKIYEGAEHSFDDEFVVFDIETTGLSQELCEIIEIGAVRVREGRVLDRFQAFAKPKTPIS